MTKPQANYYLKRIYALLRDQDADVEVVLTKIAPDVCGDVLGTRIRMDPTYEILSILIHECLHILYNLPESGILEMEAGIVSHLSPRQWRNLTIILAEVLQKPRT